MSDPLPIRVPLHISVRDSALSLFYKMVPEHYLPHKI
jgi:hypothetical protein